MSNVDFDAAFRAVTQSYNVQQFSDEEMNKEAVMASGGDPAVSSTCVTMTGCVTMTCE